MAAPIELEIAQTAFLRDGGVLQRALREKYKKGELVADYEFVEYPKCLNLSLGKRSTERSVETIKGQTLRWTEVKETFAPLVVGSAGEERATRRAFDRAVKLGVEINPHWTPENLRHYVALAERSDPAQEDESDLDPPPAPAPSAAERIAALRAELAALEADAVEAPAATNMLATPAPPPRKRSAAALPVVAPDPVDAAA